MTQKIQLFSSQIQESVVPKKGYKFLTKSCIILCKFLQKKFRLVLFSNMHIGNSTNIHSYSASKQDILPRLSCHNLLVTHTKMQMNS